MLSVIEQEACCFATVDIFVSWNRHFMVWYQCLSTWRRCIGSCCLFSCFFFPTLSFFAFAVFILSAMLVSSSAVLFFLYLELPSFFGALVLDTYFLLLAVSFFIQLLFDVAPVQPPSVLQCVVVSLGSACAFSLRTPWHFSSDLL